MLIIAASIPIFPFCKKKILRLDQKFPFLPNMYILFFGKSFLPYFQCACMGTE